MNIYILLEIIQIIIFIIIGAFIRSYLPNYMKEKGKNLATKEDISDITKKTEEVKNEFQQKFFEYSKKSKFEEEHCYKQFSELYSRLYAIVSQSEYFRYFNNMYSKKEASFDEYPFFEIVRSQTHQRANLFTGEILENQTVNVNDSITDFNKKEICEFIIANSDLASKKLLKLAVAYRFVNSHYGGSDRPTTDKDMLNGFNEEELRLIRELVKNIIIDYNNLAKVLNFNYSNKELTTGLFDDNDLK